VVLNVARRHCHNWTMLQYGIFYFFNVPITPREAVIKAR